MPYLYILTARQTCPREGRIQFQEPFSFSGSLILFDLLTSSWSSVTKRRSYSTWVYLPQVWSLLPSCTGINVGHTLQPGTWAAAGSHQSSIWAAASVVVGVELSEAVFFCWVDKLRGASVPFLHTPPHKLPCHTPTDGPSPVCPPWSVALPQGFFIQGVGRALVATAPSLIHIPSATVTQAVCSW